MKYWFLALSLSIFQSCVSEANTQEKETEIIINEDSVFQEVERQLLSGQTISQAQKKQEVSFKNVIAYFRGYACVNCTYQRQDLWDYESLSIINESFEFADLIVDDKNSLEKENYYFSEVLNDTVRTVGMANLNYQLIEFGTKNQPAYYIINTDGKTTDSLIGSSSKMEFLDFLERNLPE